MSSETILVVDDEPDIRDIVSEILDDEGYDVVVAENAQTAREQFAQQSPGLVLLDIWMPGTDGISLLKEWHEQGLDTPVIMISGHGNVETAVEAIRYGAYDFLEKPLSTAKLLITVQRAIQNNQLKTENRQLKDQLKPSSKLIGSSQSTKNLLETISKIAATESWVLVEGEPGSGKGVVAHSIHNASRRADHPMVHVSLAAVPKESLAVQLFGAEEADGSKFGYFDQARSGTLFLDSIGDLDMDIQGKLLSALEDGRYVRVGGQAFVDINVRVVAATNQNLMQAVAEGTFREDLYYRLNALSIHVPPLRDHREDIPELVSYYVDQMVSQDQVKWRQISTGAMNALRNHDWPGNVRELRNIVQRLLISGDGEEVSSAEIDELLSGRAPASGVGFPETVFDMPIRDARDEFERSYLKFHLDRTNGNITELSQVVGMERTHLYRKLKGLGIDSRSRKGE